MKFTLPYPPTSNHRLAFVRGFMRKSAKARAYESVAKLIAKSQANKTGFKPMAGHVSISFVAYRPRKSGDLDNLFKLTLDALKGVAWIDDKQIVHHRDNWLLDDKVNPRIEIEVRPAVSLSAAKLLRELKERAAGVDAFGEKT